MSGYQPRWNPADWKKYTALQQPAWDKHPELNNVKKELLTLPPLVFAGEIELLKKKLALASKGEAFLLQGGDCAESFSECKAITIRETFKVILQMAVVLTYTAKCPVIKVGRIAGQYAKPRSNPTEIIDGVEYPVYRGDMVNKINADHKSREPDPKNLLEGYFRSAATLNLIRAFSKGGFASLKNIHKWNKEFILNLREGQRYEEIAREIDSGLSFMETIGINSDDTQHLKEVNFFTSHEALLLDYEETMVRTDSLSDKRYCCSAHMLWIGDRTRALDHAHVQFLKNVHNPIGFKIGLDHDTDNICRILEELNPENLPGKIVLITRFGAEKAKELLPKLIRKVRSEGHNVVWSCDPMHGNTYAAGSRKTRNLEDIFKEISNFFSAHYSEGSNPGGIHIELTGLDVTECTGGLQKIAESNLSDNYVTTCDPRLNAQQSIELAFRLADMLRG